ncbi:outer membrane protein assembly factor BamA [Geothrix sp. PMB-07]|uniref:outer membrane protein assembly factor BamA n=1 Tax=Geothrix sp. PMB-07 TaxID=3068640 RepID=UPI002741E1C1|nr:outer membrane protein assembly factor BamA [Geothrix sp. PMB-07]WLT30868.1 outer membrane protein assembly factor BamA [Geothrix sp. PMB-07]
MTQRNMVWNRVSPRWWKGMLPLTFVALVAGTALPLAAQDLEPLVSIEVIGAQKQTSETVIFKSGVKVGDDLRSLDFTAVLEKLWASGSFDDIKLELAEAPGGKKLIIRIKERPLIKEVDFRGGTEVGLTNIKDKVKEKKLTINPDTVYDPETARKVKDMIVDQAGEKGFRNPVVDITLEPMAGGVARLVFDIKEGGKARIYKVAFRGNKVFSSSELRSAMKKTRQHWMFSWLTTHDLLVDKNLDEDLENLKKAYWRRGYKDVFVGKPIIEVEDRTTPKQKKKNEKRIAEAKSPKYDLRATLTIPILEGEQFYEGTFKAEGGKLFRETFYKEKYAEVKRDNQSFLRKFFNIKPSLEAPKPGTKPVPFDLDAVNQTVDKLKEAYSNQAYIMFRTERKYDVREEDGVKKVDTTLKLDEGEPYTVRRIEFEGNLTTKDKVLRRSMLMREGDPFQTDRFKDSILSISQLSFFDVKGSDPKVDLVADKPQVDVTIKGEEAGVNEVLFQGGYGSLFGFSLGVSFSTRNLGGGGETLSLSYNGGKFSKNISLGFTEPFVFDLPYSFSTSVSNGSADYDASRVGIANAYKQFTRSFGASVGARLSNWLPNEPWAFFTTYSTGYSFRLIRIEGGQNFYFRDTPNQLTSTFSQSLAYSTVNHQFKPTNGTRVSFGLEYGGWQFGGDRPFLRATWEFAKFTNVADRHIFAFNASYGYLQNLGKEDLPLYDLYRPGGENSIRGYRYGQVGSVLLDNNQRAVVVGGNKQFVANAEYQFKIADQFRLVFFYDAGNAWGAGTKVFSHDSVTYKDNNNNEYTFRNPTLIRSTGVEFRFFLPISPAPLRLIWARKLNPYPFDTEGKTDFQFSIGTTF